MSVGQQPLMTPALFVPLKAAVHEYGIRNLVETGTGPSSSGMEAARSLGLRGYSCDVFGPCVERAREVYPDFTIGHANSLDFFRDILSGIEGPTFFWLDGHCPTDSACLPGDIFPPYEEMLLIKQLKKGYERDVLWLDDMAMVTTSDNPVATPWDVDLAGVRWRGADEHTMAEYYAVFEDTHDNLMGADGILRIVPK